MTARGPQVLLLILRVNDLARLRAGLVDLVRAGLAGPMEADVILERAVMLASSRTRLGMRLCALELCSVLLIVN